MTNDITLFDIFTEELSSNKFTTRIIIKNITQVFYAASSKDESCYGAILKTISFIKNVVNQVEIYKLSKLL